MVEVPENKNYKSGGDGKMKFLEVGL